jgi:hypothetical protein
VDLIRAVERSEGVRIVEIDNARYYLHAEAPSIGPPQGVRHADFPYLFMTSLIPHYTPDPSSHLSSFMKRRYFYDPSPQPACASHAMPCINSPLNPSCPVNRTGG